MLLFYLSLVFPSLHFIVSCGQVIKFRPIGCVQKRDEQLPGWTVHELESGTGGEPSWTMRKDSTEGQQNSKSKGTWAPDSPVEQSYHTNSNLYEREKESVSLIQYYFKSSPKKSNLHSYIHWECITIDFLKALKGFLNAYWPSLREILSISEILTIGQCIAIWNFKHRI